MDKIGIFKNLQNFQKKQLISNLEALFQSMFDFSLSCVNNCCLVWSSPCNKSTGENIYFKRQVKIKNRLF